MAEITREVLQNRIAEYEQLEQDALAQANAAHGALVALRELVQVLDVPADFVAQPVSE
jgi:hypothetical protein